ncbi:protein SLC31A2 [Diretmus argenteus]
MTFEASSRVMLLFDFWDVHGPAGMLLSVFVVFLLTVLYELLKVWRLSLGNRSQLGQGQPPYSFASSECRRESNTVLTNSASESSLAPVELHPNGCSIRNSWALHGIQTALHILQVSLGYILMLCVMSYNTWIFLGVIAGSAIGYFIAFPLLRYM